MDLLHLGLDGVDELFAARDVLNALLELVGQLLDFDEPAFDRGQLLLAERDLCPALLQLLEHLLGARELIFRRLNLSDGVALPALDAIELGQHLVFHRRRAREIL